MANVIALCEEAIEILSSEPLLNVFRYRSPCPVRIE
jgi:hypothetical protein